MRRSRVTRAIVGCATLLGACAGVNAQVEAGREGQVEPGTHEWSMTHGGRTRTYRVHVPPAYDPAQPPALILALHGGTGTGRGTEILTGLSPLADREGFVVAYPDGVGRTWNDGRELQRFEAMREKVDDVDFLGALIDELVRRLAIDPTRVYATGISNGGHMVNRLGLELAHRLAAIAPVAATVAVSIAQRAPPAEPIAVIDFHGTADEYNYWGGGGRAGGVTVSVPRLIAFWTERNRCQPEATIEELPDVADDGTRVRRHTHRAGAGGVEVVLIEIEGGGHTWPGGYQYLPEDQIGRTSRDIDASAMMWEFFTRYSRPRAGTR